MALIGAGALAVGYPRSTRDLDLATEIDPSTQLRDVERACINRGWQTHLDLPDVTMSIADLRIFCRRHGLEHAFAVGYSMGGGMSHYLACHSIGWPVLANYVLP